MTCWPTRSCSASRSSCSSAIATYTAFLALTVLPQLDRLSAPRHVRAETCALEIFGSRAGGHEPATRRTGGHAPRLAGHHPPQLPPEDRARRAARSRWCRRSSCCGPGSAYSALCACGGQNCACGSLCCDGYTEFCCTMTGHNVCPPGTIAGGLVEGRRLAVLQRAALLHRLQRDLSLRRRRLLSRQLLQLALGLRLRQRRLQQPEGRLHPVPLRPVQPAGRARSVASRAGSSRAIPRCSRSGTAHPRSRSTTRPRTTTSLVYRRHPRRKTTWNTAWRSTWWSTRRIRRVGTRWTGGVASIRSATRWSRTAPRSGPARTSPVAS